MLTCTLSGQERQGGRAKEREREYGPRCCLAICKKAKSKVKTVLAVQNDHVRDHGPMPVVSSSRSISNVDGTRSSRRCFLVDLDLHA